MNPIDRIRCLAGLLLATCVACVSPPSAQDYLDVGFRSPEQALHSFQTAMAGDQIDLEYRCLGRNFRRQHGIDGMTYRLGREELFKEFPFVKLIAQAEITDSSRIDATHHQLVLRVKNWFADRSFRVTLEREDYCEGFNENVSVFFDFASFNEHVFTDEESPSLLYTVTQTPPDFDPAELTELCFGREWRIAGFEPIEPGTAAP